MVQRKTRRKRKLLTNCNFLWILFQTNASLCCLIFWMLYLCDTIESQVKMYDLMTSLFIEALGLFNVCFFLSLFRSPSLSLCISSYSGCRGDIAKSRPIPHDKCTRSYFANELEPACNWILHFSDKTDGANDEKKIFRKAHLSSIW